jgi:hypothetical protein
MRHRLDALEDRGGRLYLGGELYTGVAYEVVGDRVTANYQITNGTRGGPADAWDEHRTRVLLNAVLSVELDDVNDRFPEVGDYYDGALFEGVAYRFDRETGMLRQETDFRTEPVGPSREWFDSGVLSSYDCQRRPDGSSVSELYFPDGQVRTFYGDKIRWNQTEQRRLRTLYLAPGFPESDLRPAPKAVDAVLRLSGKGVTDDILERLTNLEALEELDLDKTAITAKGLETFRVCSKLRRLLTYPGNEFNEADVRQLLAFTPNCRWSARPA